MAKLINDNGESKTVASDWIDKNIHNVVSADIKIQKDSTGNREYNLSLKLSDKSKFVENYGNRYLLDNWLEKNIKVDVPIFWI